MYDVDASVVPGLPRAKKIDLDMGSFSFPTVPLDCGSQLAPVSKGAVEEKVETSKGAGKGKDFLALLDLSRGKHAGLGIVPRHKGRCLEIVMVLDEGAGALWNKENPAKLLTRGCRIVWVDGVAGDVEQMMNASTQPNKLIPIRVEVPPE